MTVEFGKIIISAWQLRNVLIQMFEMSAKKRNQSCNSFCNSGVVVIATAEVSRSWYYIVAKASSGCFANWIICQVKKHNSSVTATIMQMLYSTNTTEAVKFCASHSVDKTDSYDIHGDSTLKEGLSTVLPATPAHCHLTISLKGQSHHILDWIFGPVK